MTTHFAFLRGINVGRAKRLAMADLRDVVEELGHTDVVTYLQSGNVSFAAKGRASESKLAAELRTALDERLGMDIDVVVRTRAALQQLVEGNPLREVEAEPAKLHLVFFDHDLDRKGLAALDPAAFVPEQFATAKQALYVYFADGVHRSKLGAALEKLPGAKGTARNWNTVTLLLERTT
ncbi:MAG: DUF1697 domain-containing protein [Actinomycetota bacterium]|nr:DUF1697 domain-containing protein [Actinomycetota bacterium]